MDGNHKYSSIAYWDKRFESEKEYEWVADFDQFSSLLINSLKPTDRILHVGCGNSKLSQHLYELGFKNITNLDFSPVLIQKGKECDKRFSWVCDDMRTLSNIPTSSFDVVLEKAAIESLTTRDKSYWSPSEQTLSDLEGIFSSVLRVLKSEGKFLSISFSQPHFRIPHMLKHERWSIGVETFGHNFHFFFYTATKGTSSSLQIISKYRNFLEKSPVKKPPHIVI
uniref:Methyltransf_11 domain-containing protein n=1 Tax=Rhabditophanes sp. KR3021 TaxID=114890 RepID=A0AC35U931_9BILA